MKEIQLTQNQVALVDESDFEYLNQWRWCAQKRRNTFYAVRHTPRVNGKSSLIKMHALLVGKGCDHIDMNGLNNTRANLRLATRAQNAYNRVAQANNTSGLKGISWHKRDKKWRAQITVNGKNNQLGYFDTPEEAARVYDAAARDLHGEFARLNFE